MSSNIVVPRSFEYVGAAILSIVALLQWQTHMVYKHRKKSGIKYPQLYAEKAEAQNSKEAHLFNCAQRAHQNTLEVLPIVLITTIITGLKYPIPAAAACATFSFTRILYTLGYLTGVPAKRHSNGSVLGLVFVTGLMLSSFWIVGNVIWSGL